MQFLYEWLAIGVKLENLHFIFAGIQLNMNFAHVIPDVHLISGLQLFNFLESQQDPWDYPLVDDTSAVMRVLFLWYVLQHLCSHRNIYFVGFPIPRIFVHPGQNPVEFFKSQILHTPKF